MSLNIEAVTTDVHHLLAEEAHLIGEEVQGALGHDQLHRLHELSAAIDKLAEQLAVRRPRP